MKKILLGLTGSLWLAMTAQAELIDNSSTSMSVGFTISKPSWVVKPVLDMRRMERYGSVCQDTKFNVNTRVMVNAQGNITNVQIARSSGKEFIDIEVLRAVRRAKLRPFMKDGEAVDGMVEVPFRIIIPKMYTCEDS